MFFNALFIIFGIFMIYSCNCANLRQWNYQPLSIVPTTSDETKLQISARVHRLGRDEYAISAVVDWKYDSDETTMVELSSFISQSGSEEDYTRLPFKIDKQSLVKTFETFYQDLIVGTYGNCSNLPKPEDAVKSPFPKNRYVFDRCVASGDGMPNVLPAGYYKIVLAFSGEVDWGFTLYVKITTKRIF